MSTKPGFKTLTQHFSVFVSSNFFTFNNKAFLFWPFIKITTVQFLAVYCNRTVPETSEEYVIALHNAEVLAANDSDWNSYTRNVTYTCPEGSVLQYPNQVSYYNV